MDSQHEGRAKPRRRTILGGQIAPGDGKAQIACKIRDLSEGGARLSLPNPQDVPDQFTLTMSDGRGPFRAEIAWRGETSIGIAFVNESTVVA